MEENIEYDEIIDKGLRYNFVPYDVPRLATYNHPGNEYKFPIGWIDIPKTVLVIGETKDSYITELKNADHGEWTDKKILYKYILPMGFHKSRFLKWEDTQLTLF